MALVTCSPHLAGCLDPYNPVVAEAESPQVAKSQAWEKGANKMRPEPLAVQACTCPERKRGELEVGVGAPGELAGSGWGHVGGGGRFKRVGKRKDALRGSDFSAASPPWCVTSERKERRAPFLPQPGRGASASVARWGPCVWLTDTPLMVMWSFGIRPTWV